MTQLLRPVALLALLSVLAVACAAPRAAPAIPPPAEPMDPPAVDTPAALTVSLVRSPTCGCCAGHGEHLERAGYRVSHTITEDYTSVKDAYAIPHEMRSCHVSLVGDYFVEGHVPAAAIEQLLREQPAIDGIALPGMPAGSPGMGGVADGPLIVYAISQGGVVGELGRFVAPVQ